MGSFHVSCAFSNLDITDGDPIKLIFLYSVPKGERDCNNIFTGSVFRPFLPFILSGHYNDYGTIKINERDPKNKLILPFIIKQFGCSSKEEFLNNLDDYCRGEKYINTRIRHDAGNEDVILTTYYVREDVWNKTFEMVEYNHAKVLNFAKQLQKKFLDVLNKDSLKDDKAGQMLIRMSFFERELNSLNKKVWNSDPIESKALCSKVYHNAHEYGLPCKMAIHEILDGKILESEFEKFYCLINEFSVFTSLLYILRKPWMPSAYAGQETEFGVQAGFAQMFADISMKQKKLNFTETAEDSEERMVSNEEEIKNIFKP